MYLRALRYYLSLQGKKMLFYFFRKKILVHATVWTTLRTLFLSEISQSQDHTVIPLMDFVEKTTS
jgi:hypothetical protein